MSDVMTGRERIAVAANDTLERVLTRLRAVEGTAVVLDIDERSPLLISLQQLHSLDEVAQAHGVQVAIASTNSKLLNAARVFGLAVIDTRATPLPAPSEEPRLLAGQPLGQLDQQEGEAAEETAKDENEPELLAGERHYVRLTPTPSPAYAKDAEPTDEPTDADDLVSDEPTWSAREERPVVHSSRRRLDRYGQPYPDDYEDGGDDEAFIATRGKRTIRSRQPIAPPASTAPEPDTDGWDDERDEEGRLDPTEYERGPRRDPARGGIAGFWGDVRAWMDARRGGTMPPDAPEWDDADESDADGWDEPPYQQRQAARSVIAVPTDDASQAPTEGEEDESLAAPPREIGRGRAGVPARERTARLPVITSAIAYAADETDEYASRDDYADEVDDEGWQHRRPVGAGRFALGSLLFTLLIIATLLGVVLYLLLPTATVTLAARTGQVMTEFRVVVGEIDPSSPDGQPTAERIVVPAKRLRVPLNATATKPATGARLEPDVTAGGTVVLTNPARAAVTVPKGTALEATDGRQYITTEEVTIGPGDPYDSGTYGSATVKVAAGIRGSGGNAPIGAVRGQLASGIYYTNKTAPIAGGSDRRIATISAQDRAAAQAAAEAATRGKGPAALNGAVPAGATIMHDTSGVGNYAVQFDAKEGADGDSVTATVTAEVTALVYTPGEIEARARAEAERRLGLMVKPGEPIVAGSTQIGAPQLVEDVPGQRTYAVNGAAQTRAVLGSDAERERLVQELARKDDTDARAVIAAIPGVASSTIDYQSGPFPERMPWLPSHITVRIAEVR